MILLCIHIILLIREETPCEFVAKGAGGRMLRGNLDIQILAARYRNLSIHF
jgi:hypothetical protein